MNCQADKKRQQRRNGDFGTVLGAADVGRGPKSPQRKEITFLSGWLG